MGKANILAYIMEESCEEGRVHSFFFGSPAWKILVIFPQKITNKITNFTNIFEKKITNISHAEKLLIFLLNKLKNAVFQSVMHFPCTKIFNIKS